MMDCLFLFLLAVDILYLGSTIYDWLHESRKYREITKKAEEEEENEVWFNRIILIPWKYDYSAAYAHYRHVKRTAPEEAVQPLTSLRKPLPSSYPKVLNPAQAEPQTHSQLPRQED